MFVIIGDQCTKDETGRIISDNNQLNHIDDCQIILDTKDIEFGFTKLSQCRLLDAYKFLSCKRKTLSSHQRCYLTNFSSINLIKKTDCYVQEVSLQNLKIEKRYNMFLVENIVSAFCKKFGNLNERDWWLYAAQHKSSGVRIIAGIGNCIVLSRFLTNDQNIQEEISQSLFYLRRHGLYTYPKIFTMFEGVDHTTKKIDLNRIHKQLHIKHVNDIDSVLVEFLKNHSKSIKPIFSLNNNLITRIKTCNSLYFGILSILIANFIFLMCMIYIESRELSNTSKNITAVGNNIKFQITENNYNEIERFALLLKNSPPPNFHKIMEICAPYNITINEICLEKNIAKIRACLSSEELNKLSTNKLISIDKTSVAIDEFEGLLASKTVNVILCIKIN